MAAKKEVVSWKEQMKTAAQEVVEVEKPQGTSGIGTQGGILKYGGEAVPDNKLPCVIVAAVFENAYYPNKYDPDNPQPPTCFAFSADGEDMVPHTESSDRQDTACAGCPQNKFEKENGKWLPKGCKNIRRLLLIPADVVAKGADEVPGAEMAMLKTPVTSTKIYSKYAKTVATTHERPPWGVITEIGAEPHAKHQFHLTFETAAVINDDAILAAIAARINEAQEQLMTPYEPPEEIKESDKY